MGSEVNLFSLAVAYSNISVHSKQSKAEGEEDHFKHKHTLCILYNRTHSAQYLPAASITRTIHILTPIHW